MQDVDLMQRLRLAESDLLTSLLDGTQVPLASYHQWSVLPSELLGALQNGDVGHETLSLAHLVASRISKIASCFLDIKRDEESSTVQLQSDCDAMLHQMGRFNINAVPDAEKPSGTSRLSRCSNVPVADADDPPSLVSAYQWLLDNLHNPYPTSEVKTRISVASSCQVTSVNSWFINARRRIGWTTLCRKHFSNCRADMIDAAYRALVEEDSQRMLSPELRHSFVAMKVAAESLYSSITRSAFTGDPDAAVDSRIDGRKGSADDEKCGAVKQVNSGKTAEDSYPSPARSIVESPVLALDASLADESEEEEVAPPTFAGSKRRWSSIEPENQLAPTARRPIKRLRASTTSLTLLPSPPSSTDGIELPLDFGSPRLSSDAQPETSNALPSRTGYVSAVDDSRMTQHSGGIKTARHLYTVSHPLPCHNIGNESIDDWFNTNFDSLFAIPLPVDATEPDLSTSWEVELFKDYRIPDNPACGPKWHPPPITDVSAATHLPEFDGLLQSIASDTYVAPLDNMLSSNITVDPHTTFLDVSIPDVSHIDWTSLLDSSDAYPSTVDSTFSQHPTVSQPLPDIDLSMLQFPPLTPSVQSHSDLASKRAKLDQLHAMQEAVRQMERELQSEGVIL